jgi:hypothetical protein
MTTLRTLLAATTALAALTAVPAIGAVRVSENPASSMFITADLDAMLILASSDDDDDEDKAGYRSAEDDDDCEDEDDDDDKDNAGCTGAAIPAPAGTVAPPANGLFGTGAAPQVRVN